MTTKRVSQKPCQSNNPPALRSASKQRGTVSTSPKAERRKNGESAKEHSKPGSNPGANRTVSTGKKSKASSQKPSGSPSASAEPLAALARKLGQSAIEFRLRFSLEEWRQIRACAAFDKEASAKWVRKSVLSWVPGYLEAIREEGLTPEEAAEQAAKQASAVAAIRQMMASDNLGMSSDESAAASLCGAWEGTTFAEFSREAILLHIEASFGDMEGFASGAVGFRHGGKKEKAWARKCHREAAPIMARLGWKDGAFRQFPAKLPDRPTGPESAAAAKGKGGRK